MDREEFNETVLPKAGGTGRRRSSTTRSTRPATASCRAGRRSRASRWRSCTQRSTYDHDIDSVVGFLGFGDPNLTHDANSWMDSAGKIDFTFNWFYVDDKDTGYYVSGLDPVRNPAADPTLPTWGTGRDRVAGLPHQGRAPPRDRPEARLLHQLEQQAGAGLRDRRGVRLRPDLPIGDARPAAQAAARRAPARPGPLRRGQGDGDRCQPGPRRRHAQRPAAEVRRQPRPSPPG